MREKKNRDLPLPTLNKIFLDLVIYRTKVYFVILLDIPYVTYQLTEV